MFRQVPDFIGILGKEQTDGEGSPGEACAFSPPADVGTLYNKTYPVPRSLILSVVHQHGRALGSASHCNYDSESSPPTLAVTHYPFKWFYRCHSLGEYGPPENLHRPFPLSASVTAAFSLCPQGQHLQNCYCVRTGAFGACPRALRAGHSRGDILNKRRPIWPPFLAHFRILPPCPNPVHPPCMDLRIWCQRWMHSRSRLTWI